MRVVITGASGNIGTALLRRLGDEPGTGVVGLARRVPDVSAETYAGVDWQSVDVAAPDADRRMTELFRDADAVVHLAWKLQPNHREREEWATNVSGTNAVLRAVAAAGVPHLVVLSSVAAYSRGPKRHRVDESWPTGGIHTSHYSRQKAANERLLDAFELAHPGVVVTRVRPGLVFQADAASEIARLFLGPHLPSPILGWIRLPVLVMPSQIIAQAVHADDVADALARMLERRAGGAFNLADEPVLDPPAVARVMGARAVVPIRLAVVRAIVWATWKLRLQASDPGWLDVAANVPVMSTARARRELGWTPRSTSTGALREILDSLARRGRNPASPPLSH